jgi:hypothetical protein
VPNPDGDNETLDALSSDFILPPKDPDFLRRVNPAFLSKLNLGIELNHQRFGLEFANSTANIFWVAHLYHSLKKVWDIDGQWKEMDEILRMH